MSQATLERDLAPEAENSAPGGFARTALRVVVLSVVVTALIAGLYAMFGSNGSDPLAAQAAGAGTTKGTTRGAATGAKAPTVKTPTYAEKAAALAAKLPTNAGAAERRAKLISYLGKMDLKLTAASSPATAASKSCQFLRSGTSPKELINGVAQGSGYTKAQSKAFLLGATTLYCPAQAKNFR